MKKIKRVTVSLGIIAVLTAGTVTPATAQSSGPQLDMRIIQNEIASWQTQAQAQIPTIRDLHNMIPIPAGSSAPVNIPGLPAPAPVAPPSTGEEARIQAETISLINQHRSSRGLRAVSIDPKLSAQAKNWATNMANGGSWNTSPDGGNQGVFVSNFASPESLFNSWKKPGLIDNPTATRIGVGVVIKGSNTYANIQML